MRRRIIYNTLSLFILMFIMLVPESCSVSSGQHFLSTDQTGGVLKDIIRRGKLVALTDDNPFNYFEMEGEPRGYHYEMLKKFANSLGVELEVIVEPDYHKALQYLQQRRVDIVAMEMPVVNDHRFAVDHTRPLFLSKQVLIQRKPDNWRRMRDMKKVDAQLVRDLKQLEGKTITLSGLARRQYYLSDLQHATGNSVLINTDSGRNVGKLIESVATGESDYTIAFENTANAYSLIYNDLDVKTIVSPEIGVSWVVRKGSVNLREAANQWIEANQNSREFKYQYTRHFENPRYVYLALGMPIKHKTISDYDDVIRQMSANIGWDWRLLSALIYRESKFRTDVRSRVGAFGLMQLMPATARRFGAHEGSTPQEQIEAGVRLIKYLDNQFKGLVPDPEERKKFVLAAYNIGLAHVLDAYKLAEKHDKNPMVWADNVEYCLLSKSQPEFYNDPVVKHGRVSGKETQRFVTDVLEKYDHYKTIAKD
ncbi:MAG: transporter substrate-binding domain-containing protein [Bacteroidales bacterium]|nr:transporter substrate-binding domain-containing protein [Bacteroidales bacterium]